MARKISTKELENLPKLSNEELQIRTDEIFKKSGFLTVSEIKKLTNNNKIEILRNTINKVKKFYYENDSSYLSSSLKQIEIYQLEYNHRKKEYGSSYVDSNYKKLMKMKFISRFFIHIDKKDFYSIDIYNFFIDYFKFRWKYIENKISLDYLSKAIENDKSGVFKNELSKRTCELVKFHNEINENQLAQYYNYNYVYEKIDENEKLKDFLETNNALFFLFFRQRIREVTINTTIKNPYE